MRAAVVQLRLSKTAIFRAQRQLVNAADLRKRDRTSVNKLVVLFTN